MEKVVDKLTADQVKRIIAGFRTNDQLYQAGHLTSKYGRLKKFLERTTGNVFEINGSIIKKIPVPAPFDDDDEVPF